MLAELCPILYQLVDSWDGDWLVVSAQNTSHRCLSLPEKICSDWPGRIDIEPCVCMVAAPSAATGTNNTPLGRPRSQGPVGVASNCMVLKNMFQPENETGWLHRHAHRLVALLSCECLCVLIPQRRAGRKRYKRTSSKSAQSTALSHIFSLTRTRRCDCGENYNTTSPSDIST